MILSRRFALGLLGASLLVAACDSPTESEGLTFAQAWARTTPPGATTGAGYLAITNGGPADRLVSVTSAAAEKVELHESALQGQVMTMRPLGPIELPIGETTTLAPGGKHLMFVGLKAPFTAGAKIPLTLTFEIAGERKLELDVRNAAPDVHQH